MEKGNGDQKLRYNILDRKKDIMKSCEVLTQGDYTKEFPSYIIQYTKAKPILKYSYNPAKATCHLQNRHQMLATLLPEIEALVYTFLTSMKPKRYVLFINLILNFVKNLFGYAEKPCKLIFFVGILLHIFSMMYGSFFIMLYSKIKIKNF